MIAACGFDESYIKASGAFLNVLVNTGIRIQYSTRKSQKHTNFDQKSLERSLILDSKFKHKNFD